MNASDIRTLQILMAVDRERSYAGAARALGLTRAAVSRNITEAEKRLNLRLAKRTTRQIALSPAAKVLLKRVAQPLEDIESAILSLEDSQQELKGIINISVSNAFGRHMLLPLLQEFAQRHPLIEYAISLTESIENLISSPTDLAIRLGAAESENIIARRLRGLSVGVYAASNFNPKMTINELKDAPKIAFHIPATNQIYQWQLESSKGEIFDIDIEHEKYEVDSIEALLDLTKAGLGIAIIPDYLAEPSMRNGEINKLFKGYRSPVVDCYLCYFHRKHIPKRIRALIEFLIVKL